MLLTLRSDHQHMLLQLSLDTSHLLGSSIVCPRGFRRRWHHQPEPNAHDGPHITSSTTPESKLGDKHRTT